MTDKPKNPILTNPQAILSRYRDMMKQMPEEVRQAFQEIAKMPIKDRVQLMEFQMTYLLIEMQAKLVGKEVV